jgi:arylsulfatase A-like enzyme
MATMLSFPRRWCLAIGILQAWLLWPVLEVSARVSDKPHLLLIIADDISWDDLGCYGNPQARTPRLDALARSGRRFEQAYLTASSCSPSRSSVITGRYPHNNGKGSELHQPIAGHLPWFPQLLRQAGYYTAIVGKHHMKADDTDGAPPLAPEPFELVDGGKAAGNSGGHAHWRSTLQQRPKDRPFFGWFASMDAHRDWEADEEWDESRYGPKHLPSQVRVPGCLVDDQATRRDLASYYNEVTRFDFFVGEVVDELQEQGMLENTLIMILADNGRPFPRAKTRLHDSGMKTYLIAHWPQAIMAPGQPSASLVSAIDLAPTFLDAAGIEAPATFQGVSLLPVFASPAATVRQHAFSEHNWHDYEAHGRAVRSAGYLYLRNQRPQFAWQGPADSVRSPSHQSLLAAEAANQLTSAQAEVLWRPRPREELYRMEDDPDQLRNLIDSAEHREARTRLATLLDRWIEETGDDTPETLTPDMFDRGTGGSLSQRKKSLRGTPPGEQRRAAHINHPGPR